MTRNDDDADHADALLNTQLSEGRVMLWVALVASIVLILSLIGKGSTGSIVLFFVCLIAACYGGPSGISMVAPALGTHRGVAFACKVLALAPFLNVFPIGYFLWQAQGASHKVQERLAASRSIADARARAQQRANRPSNPQAAPQRSQPDRPAPPPAAAPAQASKSGSASRSVRLDLSKAIATVKVPDVGNTPDGQLLGTALVDASGLALSKGNQPICRASLGMFGVMYLVDEGDRYRYVSEDDLKDSAVSVEQLHRIGLENLIKLVNGDQPGLSIIGAESPYHGLAMGGQFEASLVLLDALWDGALKKFIPNGLVLAIPNRDVCLFCDARSVQAIAQIRDLAANSVKSGDHPLSATLITRVNGRWKAFDAAQTKDLAPLEFEL
jgi:Protein of unknown function (DUF1444)